jgi:purine-binding chemotaxis protein CheW
MTETNQNNSDNSQYLSFTVGEEVFGVDIMMVREIKGWTDVTRLPNSPEFLRGVMNLRGVILPIFDLRCRFGLGLTQAESKHVIIIIALETRSIGILVDAVSDILTVTPEEVKAAPAMQGSTSIDEKYVSGLISVDQRMVILLDMESCSNLKQSKPPFQI